MGQISQKFDCEIRNCWLSPDAGTLGYNCFDSGGQDNFFTRRGNIISLKVSVTPFF
ncbi:hypothetical protein IFU23_07850 [Pantoea agglomerans]|nr:hypothetical protein [Pantoea agglomerans]MBD8234027.1 hypothetical protein [Pantoea agglomerans]